MAALSHLTVACLLKKTTNTSISLVALIIYSYLSDIIALIISISGIDSILYKNTLLDGSFWSHSLFIVTLISLSICIAYLTIRKQMINALFVFATIFSHWLIDFITWPLGCIWTNAPGLMIYWDNNIRAGLGLYNTKTAMVITEAFSLLLSILIIISIISKRTKYMIKEAS